MGRKASPTVIIVEMCGNILADIPIVLHGNVGEVACEAGATVSKLKLASLVTSVREWKTQHMSCY